MVGSWEVEPISATSNCSPYLLRCLPQVLVSVAANSSRFAAKLQETYLKSKFFTITGIFKAHKNLSLTYCLAFWPVQCELFCWSCFFFFFISYVSPMYSLLPFGDWIYPSTSEPFPLRTLLSTQENSTWHLQVIVTKSKPCPTQWSTPQRSLHIITFVLRNLNCRPVAIAFCYLNLNQSCQRLLDLTLFSATCSFKK